MLLASTHLRSGTPSVFKDIPREDILLSLFSVVRSPIWIAVYGIDWTKSRRVTPDCMVPLKDIKTISGISRGMIPVFPVKGTRPDPAGMKFQWGKV
jgi:hypothetical protein